MPSPKPPSKPSANIASATARTRSVLENLQARLASDAADASDVSDAAGLELTDVATAPAPKSPDETEEDLERQLHAYFEREGWQSRLSTSEADTAAPSRTPVLDELRSRVIDGVVERILAEWARSQPGTALASGLSREVTDRLIERVLEQLRKAAEAS